MDNQKIGKYIAFKRKQKGMTQQALADRLSVTNKAVSKWETGTSLPDVSLLKELAFVLGITVDEILSGEDSFFTKEKETNEYHMFKCDKSIYKTYYQEQLYTYRFKVGFVMIIGIVLICGGYSLYSLNRFLPYHLDVMGMSVMVIGLLFLLLPTLWKTIKVYSSHMKECQYRFRDDYVLYNQEGQEVKYFYRDIKEVKEYDMFVVMKSGKDVLFINKEDYQSIKNRLFIDPIKPITTYQKKIFWISTSLLCLTILLLCLFLGYHVVLKRFLFEFMFDSLNIVVPIMSIVLVIDFIILLKIKITKILGWLIGLISLLIIIVSWFVGDMLSIHKTYYSISPDFSSQLVLKQNKESGKLYDYHYQFLCFARQSQSFDSRVGSDIKTQWLNGDNNLVIYDRRKVYVATYGDRGNGISYYYVAGSLTGEWSNKNEEDKTYQVSVQNGSLTVKTNNQEMVFSPQEIQQYGTTAIVLTKGTTPYYVIALNKNCELDNQYQIKQDGTIMLVDVNQPTPVELYCQTPKQDDTKVQSIEDEKRQTVETFINKMQDIAYNDEKYNNYESTSDMFKINTSSTDYFEVARRAYFEEHAKPNDSGIKVDEQITTITVESGSIDDFYVRIQSVGIYSSNEETEKSGLDIHYRIMKASQGYLVGHASPTMDYYSMGLVPLNPMISRDVSKDPTYHYTK